MTSKQEKLIENYIRTKVKFMLKESLNPKDMIGKTVKFAQFTGNLMIIRFTDDAVFSVSNTSISNCNLEDEIR